MLGAIIGDMAGSIYEFDNIKTTDFDLLGDGCEFTDDSILSVAVADWLLTDKQNLSHNVLEDKLVAYTKKYPNPMGGYGGGFVRWALFPEHLYNYDGTPANGRKPYNSWGNGSAMRCSAVGWMFDTLEETERAAEISASITHNHPEGIKGAQATAAAIFMARTGKTKEEITDYIEEKYGYDLQRTCNDIRPTYGFEASCQKTVPEAIIAFLDSTDFESAIRLGVSLGGDSDTLTCITGGIAEAFYKSIPSNLAEIALNALPDEFKSILEQLRKKSNYIRTY